MKKAIIFFVTFCCLFVIASAEQIVDPTLEFSDLYTDQLPPLMISPIAVPEIEIVVQPSSATVRVGSNAIFTCIAIGDDLTYYWQYSSDGGRSWYRSSSNFPGYNTNQMTVAGTTGRNGFLYRCVISNSTGTVYTAAASLTVVASGEDVPSWNASDVILLSVNSVAAAGSWFEAIIAATGMSSLYITMMVVLLVVGSLLIPILTGGSPAPDTIRSQRKPAGKNGYKQRTDNQ